MNPLPAARRALLIALVLASVGCAHQIEMVSAPPGAEVVVNDEVVCHTPCSIEERAGHADITRVEVRQRAADGEPGEAVRFDLLQEGWTFEPVVLGVVLGGAAFVASAAASGAAAASYTATTLFLVTGANVLLPSAGAAGLGFLLLGTGIATTAGAYLLGITLASAAPRIPLALAGEASRVSDDEVFIDFEEDEIYASPGDNVRRLVGASPGFTPMPAPDHDADPYGE